MTRRALVAQLAGALVVGALLVVLPADVYRQARDLLLVAAAAILAWVALAVFLVPVRLALDRTFTLGLRTSTGWLGLPRESELRATFRPLVVPFVVLVVVGVATALRGL